MSYTYSMQSNRVLLSDRHGHKLFLTEQEIGIAIHALHVLAVAFSPEPVYGDLVMKLHLKMSKQLDEKALTLEEM